MSVKQLTEHYLVHQVLSLKGGCIGSWSLHMSKCLIVGNHVVGQMIHQVKDSWGTSTVTDNSMNAPGTGELRRCLITDWYNMAEKVLKASLNPNIQHLNKLAWFSVPISSWNHGKPAKSLKKHSMHGKIMEFEKSWITMEKSWNFVK